ncbi:hypothetical protein RJT34_23987 [Clitoria ternatea]|uniref:Uncharacterized protein n=1 Tax=Clitoria ternatea TaxID=43366 RepID=A0AAN9FPV8_CLITE
MATNIKNTFMICLVAMLLLETHAKIVDTTIEVPAPQPSSSISSNLPTAQLKAVFNQKSAVHAVKRDARKHITRSRVCSSAKSVVLNACVFLLELMVTRRFAPAMTTGRPKGEGPNALKYQLLS